ncbi:hypothetical protein [Methylobacterium radiotolerans]|uniref:hypothetical protein n=1 Tax=Methylobacterium radiotolerans TaxID=31998 RepID=UPI001F233F28|nr:hypothetical protein [Methylobacterium radiotolerans]UIY44150.1 hypothetical protein LZ599_10875 [Methylobacterium radiotolerans]
MTIDALNVPAAVPAQAPGAVLPAGPPGASAFALAVLAGFTGSLQDYLASLKGEKGEGGQRGSDGASAFQQAVAAGFKGDLDDWLSSLKGDPGLVRSIAGVSKPDLSLSDIGAAAVSYKPILDQDYFCLVSDVYVAMKALTVPRSIWLPSAKAYRPGQSLFIADESESCSSTVTIAVMPIGTDRIAGMSDQRAIMSAPGQKLTFHSNGSNLWTVA